MLGRAHAAAALVAAALTAALAGPARAQRPAFADGTDPQIHDGEAGHVRVHFVTTSADAVPADDTDDSGVPDYVEEVAELAETAWDDLAARGFRAPLSDDGLVADDGGDGRFDIYLRDLVSADGNFVAEACTDAAPVHCAGYFAMENDLAGFDYASTAEGISVLTSHELFHAVQSAYQPELAAVSWTEGTAVWNEEKTFPEQGDYERFVAGFLAHPQRPFERSGGSGFGDPYSYGAALWPTFLDERYGDGVVERAWEACESLGPGADFLEAVGQVLAEDGGSLEAAWTDFTRWNLFTAERADPARFYQGGADLVSVDIDDGVTQAGAAASSVEGLSAHYVPIAVTGEPGESIRVAVTVDDGAVAAFYPQDGAGAPGDPVELERDGDALAASLPGAASGFLVLTGVRRGGLPRDAGIDVSVVASPDAGGGGDHEGGCSVARSGGGRVPGAAPLLAAAAFVLAARRRRARAAAIAGAAVRAGALAAAVLALSACAGDIRPDSFGEGQGDVDASSATAADGAAPAGPVAVVDNGDGTWAVTVNATSVTNWVYLDLGDLVQVQPADPPTSADWDLGLQRFHYALDGGVSGAGQGEVAIVDGATLADVTSAPADGWATDLPDDDVDQDTLPEYAFENAGGAWYDYDPETHVLTPKQRVYVVRGAAGDLFALGIEAYYNDAGSPAWPRFAIKPLAAR
ncbi:MAG TPA: HmuY family protein [Kofleriaceae bacterium]|nr:HmuY family protein [Kofleriaceae bacterium]